MSIEDEIVDLKKRDMLYPIIPRAAGEVPLRALFVAEKLWQALSSETEDPAWERRMGELQADLEEFVTSELITPKYLFLLYPSQDAVWEIRSVKDNPSIRVLGLFAQKDVLVLADMALREDLDGWQSRLWKQVKRNSRTIWRGLFPTYQPITTVAIDDVITGAIDGRYFKNP